MNIKWNEKTEHLSNALKKEKIHSCLISKDHALIFQYYKNNKSVKKLHKVNSCTKSITSTLIGIAYDQGLIADTTVPIIDYFPEIAQDSDPRKRLITIDHLLTMSAGFDWPEMGAKVHWPQMIHSSNWVNYVLARPLKCTPGDSMNYNSGCSQLLLAILQKVTKTSAKEFAHRFLFADLGFSDYIWHEDPQGITIGGFGLHLTVQDMLKFGELHLNQGRFGSKQLVSEKWISFATEAKYETHYKFGHYGRHWWISETSESERFYFAMGMGGQYICVIPYIRMVIAITNDTHGDSYKTLQIIRNILS